MTKTDAKAGALANIRILDLTDERSIYGAKLLADLGAQVIRPEPLDMDPLRSRGPFFGDTCSFDEMLEGGVSLDDSSGVSLWHAFFASNRRFLRVDFNDQAVVDALNEIAQAADIVLTCDAHTEQDFG